MDRNINGILALAGIEVATREGGVDRNMYCMIIEFERLLVATREGGVDRNRNDPR